MAERRMFAKTIITSDAFLDMPATARCLYFTLCMFADDDGFVNNPRSIMRQCGASDDDMKILLAKHFVLLFETGVIVIKHWRIHNYIQKDRYHPTKYQEEKSMLSVKEDGGYKLDTTCIQPVSKVDTEVRIELGKSKVSNNKYSSAPKVEVLSEVDSWFEAFYSKYPKKRDKPAAVKAFKKRCVTKEDFDIIMAGLDRWIEAWKGKDPQYIPYPAKWLNAEQYNDLTDTESDEDPLSFLPFK